MNKHIIALSLAILCSAWSAKGQRLDSLIRRLPSSQEYYKQEILTQDSLLDVEGQREETLRSYLQEGVSLNSTTPSLLVTRLRLPIIVRSTPLPQALTFPLPSLSLVPSTARVSPVDRLLAPYQVASVIEDNTFAYLQSRSISYADYTEEFLSRGREKLSHSSAEVNAQAMLGNKLEPGSIKRYADQFVVTEVERKYWIPNFESSIQFSQNYISDNWYKGGNSNLNLSMRTYFSLLYSKDKVQWLNELESKLGLYTADGSIGGPRYRISEDILRLHSNYGIKINNRWSYTLDGELRTQLFNTYNTAYTTLQAAPLAPLRTNIGIGLKYSYSTKSRVRYGRKFALSLNLAPFSHNWRWSSREDIDLARHGLKPDELSIHTFGSTFRGQMQWDFNMDVSWTSRIYFNTAYKSTEAEWENTLTMRISRYFSTRINVHLRFDDAVKPSDGWNRYLQINEVLSFGFNYKL